MADSKKPRYTSSLPSLDDIRGEIQEALVRNGELTTAASGNKYFRVSRVPMVVGGIHGELSVTWNNLLEAATVEARPIETAQSMLAKLTPEQRKALLAEYSDEV